MRFLMPHPPRTMRAMEITMRGVEAFAIPRISAMSPTSCRNHAAGFVMRGSSVTSKLGASRRFTGPSGGIDSRVIETPMFSDA